MTGFIVWDPSPEIFTIGGFSIRWYGLLFASSFFFGYLIMTRFFKKEGVPLKLLDALTTYMIIGTVIGARLGHCFFYEPGYYLANPAKILAVWEGGLASHGAAIGIILSLLIYSRVYHKPFLWVIDRIVIVTALGGMFIRLGNLMNSEIFGVPTSLPWGFVFPLAANPAESTDPRHPTQLYEAFSYLLIFFFLLWVYYRKQGNPPRGLLLGLFLVLVFAVRILIEFVKEPQVDFERTMVLNMGQWLSIPFVLAGLIFIILSLRKR